MQISEGFSLGGVCACVLLATACVVPSQGTTSFSIQAFEAGSLILPGAAASAAESGTPSSPASSPPAEIVPRQGDRPWSILGPDWDLPDLQQSPGQRPVSFVSPRVEEEALDWPASPFEPMSANTPIDLGSGLSFRLYAASELQEKDTLGFWNDFHTESLEEEQLNLCWSYRRRPGVFWVGRVGTPRVVDRTIDESLTKPGMVFATFGLQWSF